MKLLLIAAIITGVLALILAGGLIALDRSQGGRSVGSPNLAEGVLAPCPESPNCVSTRAPAEDTQHAIEAIPVSGTPADIVAAIAAVVEAQPRMAVVERGDRYLRATATSALFHFVDDVDFIVDPRCSGGPHALGIPGSAKATWGSIGDGMSSFGTPSRRSCPGRTQGAWESPPPAPAAGHGRCRRAPALSDHAEARATAGRFQRLYSRI
jgi:uncharacterized protein (DUF1499 family)